MANNKRQTFSILFSLIFAGMLFSQGRDLHKILNDKTSQQNAVVDGLVRFKQQFLAVNESRIKWESNYLREDKATDRAALIKYLNFNQYELFSDPDSIALTKVEQVKADAKSDIEIGITRYCMSSGTGDGSALQVSASSYKKLLDGLDLLSKRPDIQIGSISIGGNRTEPIAALGGFCILLRND